MYKPGTLITLRDGNVYRTSKKTVCVCGRCIDYHKKHNLMKPCSIVRLFNNEKCAKMYGEFQFPQKVFSKSSF